MSQQLPEVSRWTIQDTDAETSFPKGARQTLSHRQENWYELKWEVLGKGDRHVIRFYPLYLKDGRLSNPQVRGTVNRRTAGYYNVWIELKGERFRGNSESVGEPGENVPGPLVGQWGAESVPPASSSRENPR